MESLSDDILFYNILYSTYDVSIFLSSISKRFNKLSKGYGKELRTPKDYFLEYVETRNSFGHMKKYWINKFTKKKEGKYEEWWDNGNKRTECYYKDNKLQYKYEGWWNNGKKRIECWYKGDKKEGKYKEWYYNGNKYIKSYYKNGRKIEITL
ncbi:MORN-repeat protein [Orpheovirus IHUMI-LCC2]|uniref:MORN-repeat protein n=1 Tax=Orpheovirus IHUMI-LCC2 TaxID=2023057 RepID=A0A2I2L5N5_9VIRU|nr:MORN-repeat protein [Orpheovirus IHUMI-LCC2]SNW62837.1 MORN-repeat protein [Orpheovirus IHUMI-LCC2]